MHCRSKFRSVTEEVDFIASSSHNLPSCSKQGACPLRVQAEVKFQRKHVKLRVPKIDMPIKCEKKPCLLGKNMLLLSNHQKNMLDDIKKV